MFMGSYWALTIHKIHVKISDSKFIILKDRDSLQAIHTTIGTTIILSKVQKHFIHTNLDPT